MLPRPAQVLLETLPGWPEVHDPSLLEILTLILFIPGAIALAFLVAFLAPGWRSRSPRA